MKIPHIVWKSGMKNAREERTRYLVWAESTLGAAQQVQRLRKEQGLALYDSYQVCRLSDKGYGPLELETELYTYEALDATNDVYEDMFRSPVTVLL